MAEEIIISLTSHGKRIERIRETLDTLVNQHWRASRIILWLCERVENLNIPEGVEVRYSEDYGPATKSIPALREFPEAVIVTADDDVIYSRWWLFHLLVLHKLHPHDIIYARGHKIIPGAPYKQWKWDRRLCLPGLKNHPTGVGGVLYPPGSLHPDVLDVETMQRLCPMADDIWMKVQSYRMGTVCRRIFWPQKLFKPSDRCYIDALSSHNNKILSEKDTAAGLCYADIQLQALREYYGLDFPPKA